MTGIRVLSAGLHDTVQDRGRFGYQALGFSPAGAMDRRSAAIANLLLGNPVQAAVLECAFEGPRLLFERPAVVCLAGASTEARLDGVPLEPYAARAVEAGQTVEVGRAVTGAYAYLAVAGGVDVPSAMGSRSTSAVCGLGGLEGRALREGDVLPLAPDAPGTLPGLAARRLASHDAYFGRGRAAQGAGERPVWVRVVANAGEARLGADWLRAFYGTAFRVTARSDRMGVRLAPCVPLPPVAQADLVSEGVALGTVQVPAGGEPIVVMADHQTTGGYAKAGVVAGIDLPRLAQCRPGRTVRFERVSVEEAQRLARQEARFLQRLRLSVGRAAARAEQG